MKWRTRIRSRFTCEVAYAAISAFRSRIPSRMTSLLHSLHFKRKVAFLVVLAVLINSGNFWPPYPRFLPAWRRAPQEPARSFPLLYRATECMVCFLHHGQLVLISFGNFIFSPKRIAPASSRAFKLGLGNRKMLHISELVVKT